jgi:hypothetical protein
MHSKLVTANDILLAQQIHVKSELPTLQLQLSGTICNLPFSVFLTKILLHVTFSIPSNGIIEGKFQWLSQFQYFQNLWENRENTEGMAALYTIQL